MSDFSSTAMLRVIQLGLMRLGLKDVNLNTTTEALFALDKKRRILNELWHKIGPNQIVRLGEGVYDAPEEPALMALLMAENFLDLMQRLTRMERFLHSRHRMVIEHVSAQKIRVTHISLAKNSPPTSAEDLLVWGLIVALAKRIGVAGLNTRLDADKKWRHSDGVWQDFSWPTQTAAWVFSWNEEVQQSPHAHSYHSSGNEAEQLKQLIMKDPNREWTVERAAAEFKLSGRTLQRRLNTLQTGFSKLLIFSRVTVACRMLIETNSSPGEIGFACGFADQPHFVRSFKQQTAITPARYREQFQKQTK